MTTRGSVAASTTCSPTCRIGTSATCTTGTMPRRFAITWKGPDWQKWNAVMRQLLPEHQEKTGAERGSWDPNGDRWGDAGGRLYVTCLSLYTLEVYYRHLPIYRKGLLDQ